MVAFPRRLLLLGLIAAANVCLGSERSTQEETFEEDLLIRPLPDGNIMTHLTMRTSAPVRTNSFGLFPKVIGEIFETYGVGEVHVTFSRGQWVGHRWGTAPVAAPQGVELWAWFAPAETAVPQRSASELQVAWRGLTNAMAGLLGASLNFLESDTQHVHPRHSVRPQSGILRAMWGGHVGSHTAHRGYRTGLRNGPAETYRQSFWLRLQWPKTPDKAKGSHHLNYAHHQIQN